MATNSTGDGMNLFGKLLLASILMAAAGCASMFGGVEQKMDFSSDPEGASVYADGLLVGKTPLNIKLRKNEYKTVTLKMTGYQDETIQLNERYDSLGFLNLLNLGLGGIGFTIDASTGAMYEYAPGKFQVTLVKNSHSKSPQANINRNFQHDLNAFVSNNYYHLKGQCLTTCDNEYYETLVYLTAKTYQQDLASSAHLVEKALSETNSPDELIQKLAAEAKQTRQQVATIKDAQ